MQKKPLQIDNNSSNSIPRLLSQARNKASAIKILAIMALTPVPLFLSEYSLHVLILSFVFIIFALSWDFLFGYAGQLSLGQVAPFGVAAYVTIFLAMLYDLPSWIALIIGVFIAATINLVITLPALRLKGVYLAIVTLAFSQILWVLVSRSWGDEGVGPATFYRLYGHVTKSGPLVQGVVPHFYVSLALMLASTLSLHLIVKSRVGARFTAIRDDEVAARALGINVNLYKVLAFFISSIYAGVAGGFYSLYTLNADPWFFSVELTFRGISMAVFGGLGTLVGPALGAAILTTASEYLRVIGQFRLIVYSLILVVVLLFIPGGVIGVFNRYFRSKNIEESKTGA